MSHLAAAPTSADLPGEVNPPHLVFIDGLRGMAILAVLTVHLSQFIQWASSPFHTGTLREFSAAGARGVQLFFMVSAFTLFSSAEKRFVGDSRPFLSFYIRRAFRILPLWWLMVAVHSYIYGINGWPTAFFSFGFTRFKDGVEVFPLGWSIFVEETFYLFFPFLFARITTTKAAFNFAAAATAVAILWSNFASRVGVPSTHDFIFLFPLNQWFCFGIGIVVYHLVRDQYFQDLFLRNKRWANTFDAVSFLILFIVLRENHFVASLGLAVLFIACASPYTRFGKVARSKVLGVFGVSSYSIYLFHLLFLTFGGKYLIALLGAFRLEHVSSDIKFIVAVTPFFLFCGAFGFGAWHILERPFIRIGKLIVRFIDVHHRRLRV